MSDNTKELTIELLRRLATGDIATDDLTPNECNILYGMQSESLARWYYSKDQDKGFWEISDEGRAVIGKSEVPDSIANQLTQLESKYAVLLEAAIATMEFALRSEDIDWRTFFNIARDALREVDPALAERVEDAPYHPEWVAIEERRLKELEESDKRMAKQKELQRQLEERNKRLFGTE